MTNTFEILFNVRKYQIQNVKFFFSVLKNTALDEGIIRNEVPAKEFSLILHEYEEIRNYFLTRRLENYIKCGMSIKKETECNLLHVFAIERVLQVIGEFIKKEPSGDFNVKWLFTLYMPKSVREIFHDLRNKLSNLDNQGFMKKITLEKDINLFKGIIDDISNVYDYLKPLFNVITEELIIYIRKKLLAALKEMKASHQFKEEFQCNIKRMVESILSIQLESFPNTSVDDLIYVFDNILENFNQQLKEKKENFKKSKSKFPNEINDFSIREILQSLKCLIKLLLHKVEFLLQFNSSNYLMHYRYIKELLNVCEVCINQFDLSSLIADSEYLIQKCKLILSKMRTSPKCIMLNLTQNTEIFLKQLKTSVSISDVEKEEVRKHLDENFKDDLAKRENIEATIYTKQFTMSKEELAKNKVSYLSKKEWSNFENNYSNKNARKSLKILQRYDPMAGLLSILERKSVKKSELDDFCRRFSISGSVRSNLEKLVRGTRTKVVGNRLSYLLDRIINLEIIFIGEENIAMDLWENENQSLEKDILNRFMEDHYVRLATEMMILDFRNLLKKKMKEWEKSCGLFQGIDMRNVIAHEDIIIQNVCEWFDPSDIPMDIVRIVIDFMKDKKVIVDILALFIKADENFEIFSELFALKGNEKDLVGEKNVILEKYYKYVELLPDADMSLLENKCLNETGKMT